MSDVASEGHVPFMQQPNHSLSMITSKHSYFWSNEIQKTEKFSLLFPLSRNPYFRWYTVINKIHSIILIILLYDNRKVMTTERAEHGIQTMEQM
jgi:hypothetical protein